MTLPRAAALLAVPALALAASSPAWAHAHVSPPVAQAKDSTLFTLAVPTEKENATTTKVELTPPAGFAIDSFVAAPGWKRDVAATGSGEEAVIQRVTWSGGSVPTGEATGFQFLASPDGSKTYAFKVRQTYSDGSVVDWAGPESSDTPAPLVASKSSLGGGGGGTSTLALVALVVGVVALVVAVAALLAGSGRRSLT
jgi:periplasmic copper chaperone A